MSIAYTYCIGDIHGCYDELIKLLDIINYNSQHDHLWFTGDLVNRGPKSLEILRFIKHLPNTRTKIVLGNHDLHLLNFYNHPKNFQPQDYLQQIIDAPDCKELMDWLRKQPLLHYDKKNKAVLTHAGIYPYWNLQEAQIYAREVEFVLQQDNYADFLNNLYGNQPAKWDNNLTGYDRLRFIVNACTRMRFCDLHGNLDFSCSENIDKAPPGFLPWFKIPKRQIVDKNIKILFGHWASLLGITNQQNVFALDTGCAWGYNLTAMRLEDGNINKNS